MFDDTLVTVWSVPNYCYRCGNKAAIMLVDKNAVWDFKTFESVSDTTTIENYRNVVPYFL